MDDYRRTNNIYKKHEKQFVTKEIESFKKS